MTTEPEGPVLVTGGTGFLGPHVVAMLLKTGADVHVAVRPTSGLDRLGASLPHVTVHQLPDTTSALVDVVGGIRPASCVHLATHFVARHTTADVDELAEGNVAFGMRLAEAASVTRCPRVVVAGTAWQHHGGAAYSPVSLYAATKQALEDVLRYYAETGGFEVVVLNLFDTYGPNDPRPKLVPALLRAWRTGEHLSMSSGRQLIDLVHVDDAAAAFAHATRLALEQDFSSFAVSSGQPVTLRELVKRAEAAFGGPIAVEWGARPDRGREMLTPWDAGPRLPGWSPSIDLDTGLRGLVAGPGQGT